MHNAFVLASCLRFTAKLQVFVVMTFLKLPQFPKLKKGCYSTKDCTTWTQTKMLIHLNAQTVNTRLFPRIIWWITKD